MITPVSIIISLFAYVQSAPAANTPTGIPNCANFGKTANGVKWTTISKVAGYSSLTETFKATNVCCAGACCSVQHVSNLSGGICDPIVKGKTPGALKTVPRTYACVMEIVCGGTEDKSFVSGNLAPGPGYFIGSSAEPDQKKPTPPAPLPPAGAPQLP